VRQKILITMREHCYEPDFSLSYLSEIVGFSSTYINRCLREETGYGFMKLNSILRIARAKEELVQTDKMIKEIVANVGYMDIASFTRKFKEMEGVTPGEYRRLNGKQRANPSPY
jgi:two-component system, response regulator YesN